MELFLATTFKAVYREGLLRQNAGTQVIRKETMTTSSSEVASATLEASSSNSMTKSSAVVLEENTKISFPEILSKEENGNETGELLLCAVGVRKRSFLGLIGINIYAFGIYADCKKLKDMIIINKPGGSEEEESKANPKLTKEANKAKEKLMYEAAIDADVSMTVKLVIVFGSLTMHMVRKIFNENLGASIKKFSTSDHGELLERVLGESKENIKLPVGSDIHISKLPGYVLQTKVKGDIVSEVESQMLCKAFFNMYLGDEPIDANAKSKFGQALIISTNI